MGFISDVLSRSKIESEGKELARQFAKRLTKERAGEEKRVSAEFEILLAHALGYRRKSGLGVLGTSHLANSFQWGLIEEGWDADFAKEIGSRLAVKLAAAS